MTSDVYKSSPAYLDFLLHTADTPLILGQRLCEWCGHGAVLEQDIALSNIALDLLGLARNVYAYAAELKGNDVTEDDLAYLRGERAFKNLLLTELPNGHFGDTVMRQFFFSTYQLLWLEQLQVSKDNRLAAIAAKSLKEAQYHFKWSAEWVIRLGDGTEESHEKMQEALTRVQDYVGELFLPASYECSLLAQGVIPDVSALEDIWERKVQEVLKMATLSLDRTKALVQQGGKEGIHTEHLGYILAELQFMQRAYPNMQW